MVRIPPHGARSGRAPLHGASRSTRIARRTQSGRAPTCASMAFHQSRSASHCRSHRRGPRPSYSTPMRSGCVCEFQRLALSRPPDAIPERAAISSGSGRIRSSCHEPKPRRSSGDAAPSVTPRAQRSTQPAALDVAMTRTHRADHRSSRTDDDRRRGSGSRDEVIDSPLSTLPGAMRGPDARIAVADASLRSRRTHGRRSMADDPASRRGSTRGSRAARLDAIAARRASAASVADQCQRRLVTEELEVPEPRRDHRTPRAQGRVGSAVASTIRTPWNGVIGGPTRAIVAESRPRRLPRRT